MRETRRHQDDALDLLYRRYVEGRPKMIAMLEDERLKLEIGQQIYDLRTSAKLSQRQLAKRVGTTASVICRLEHTDYEGHSISMLQRVARALGCSVRVFFVPNPRGRVRRKPAKRRNAVA